MIPNIKDVYCNSKLWCFYWLQTLSYKLNYWLLYIAIIMLWAAVVVFVCVRVLWFKAKDCGSRTYHWARPGLYLYTELRKPQFNEEYILCIYVCAYIRPGVLWYMAYFISRFACYYTSWARLSVVGMKSSSLAPPGGLSSSPEHWTRERDDIWTI